MDKQAEIDTSLNRYFDTKEAFLDKFIESGSDHELFVASYIHGHFSVVAAKTMQQVHVLENAQDAISVFTDLLHTSIATAIKNGELSDQDAKDVTTMLVNMTDTK